jgi:hypothetical protein
MVCLREAAWQRLAHGVARGRYSVAEIRTMIQDVWLADWMASTQAYVDSRLGSFDNVQWGGHLPAGPTNLSPFL